MRKNIILFFFLSSYFLYSTDIDSVRLRVDFNANKFKYILETIFNNYADSVDIDKISEQAFFQMLNSLDKHSYYLTKEALNKKSESDKGNEIGIGINLKSFKDTLFVYNVIWNSPAQLSGIKPLDRIISIDNKSVLAISLEEAQRMLKGENNSIVLIEILTASDFKRKVLQLTRNQITVSSINYSVIIPGNDIAYLNFKKFSKISHDEFQNDLKLLEKSGMRSLIIDLRDNPGGFLEQVGVIANEFINGKEIITYTNSRNPLFRYSMLSDDSGAYKELPVIIIVNENSASACELFASVMQDLDRGIVIGRRTFGKGSAQMLWKMTDSTGFQMTVAEYLTPLGRKIGLLKEPNKTIDESMKLNLNVNAITELNQLINVYGVDSKLPIYTTKKGRTILGGASVFPDYFVENDTITLLTEVLNNKNILIEYVFLYLTNNFKALNKEYGNSLPKFSKEFFISDLMLSDLKRHSYSKNIWNEEMFQNDKKKIEILLKAEIARAFFGDLGYYSILIKNDKFVAKAIELMHEADNLLK